MPKVSIIIPVYNVEKYLNECLDSLLNQTLQDIEIICINDGSTDNSLKILNEYADRDSRIKITDKPNEGAAIARNIGINNATGDYIMFVDSDDKITTDACETAYNTIVNDKADIVIFSHNYLINNEIIVNPKSKTYTHFTSYETNKKINNDLIYIWDKIYKREFILQNNIQYLINCKTAEDIVFCWTCFLHKAKISKITKSLYIYRTSRENSATTGTRGVASDFYTFKKFENQEIYQQQPQEIKNEIIGRFCGGHNYYYKRNIKNKSARKQIDNDMQEFCEHLEAKYPKTELCKIKAYKKFKKRHLRRFVDFIFSINKIPNTPYKNITIWGLEFKIERNK